MVHFSWIAPGLLLKFEHSGMRLLHGCFPRWRWRQSIVAFLKNLLNKLMNNHSHGVAMVAHEIPLIALISIGLAFAFVGGFIAIRLHLSPIIGYLLAGIAIGPFTPGFVGEPHLAAEIAEMGVILLMFGVGMHFSVSDLWAVRSIAVPGAIIQIAAATGLGMGIGLLWGWPWGASLVFGLALSAASTVVLLRQLESLKMVDSPDGKTAVGWLIVEDLAMVLTLILLPAFAGQLGGSVPAPDHAIEHGVWVTLGITLSKVAMFIALMLVAGTRVFPWLLRQVDRTGSRELFTLAVVGLASIPFRTPQSALRTRTVRVNWRNSRITSVPSFRGSPVLCFLLATPQSAIRTPHSKCSCNSCPTLWSSCLYC